MVQPPNGGPGMTAASASRNGSSGLHNGTTSASATSTLTTRSKTNGTASANANTPLSLRHAERLDMSTVECKGKPSSKLAGRESAPRKHIHGIAEAPTFNPTEEEWKDPMEYIRKIEKEGKKYGIVKINPPANWNPKFAIDTERFHFKTRKQELNSVEGGTRSNLNYLDQLGKFHKSQGNNLNRFPSVDKRPLDLFELKKAVESRGGFSAVCKLKKWAEIGRDLGYSGKIMSSLSTSLKNSYAKWLEPYEEWLRGAKPGVQAQLEQERGGPYTPSPGTSPVKKAQPDTPNSFSNDSPAMQASQALNESLEKSQYAPISRNGRRSPTGIGSPASTPAPVKPLPATSGFTAVNAGGFTPVNAGGSPMSFAAANSPNIQFSRESETRKEYQRIPNGYGSRPSSGAAGQESNSNGSSVELKRKVPEPQTTGSPGSQTDVTNRRSKRVKKEAPHTVTGSQMQQRISMPKLGISRDKDPNWEPGDYCESCGKKDDDESIILCDGCYNGYHIYCLDPPLKSVQEADWHCPKCLVGTGEFGFEEGGVYSLKQFQEKANNFKEKHFSQRMPFDPIKNGPRPVTEDDVEREFWRLVSSITETVEVEYGADIHSSTHGSGFPTMERNLRDPYSYDPWNLTVLPLLPDSLFRHIRSDISGMTVPWLYVGMCFSTFCWHNEDHYTYSANYQHFGATKTWYGIPGDDAELFEKTMRAAVPELFESQPDLLFQLVTLLPPDQLRRAGVNVYAADQRAGQYVITFPQAYHAGFNHGFNFNEAVNFAPADWEPFGHAGVDRLREFRRQPCFSHDELLITAASSKDISIKTAKWLAPALDEIHKQEQERRDIFEAKVVDDERSKLQIDADRILSFERNTDTSDLLDDDQYVCSYCKAYSYLSRFVCQKTKIVSCLDHVAVVNCCQGQQGHAYHTRLTLDDLSTIRTKMWEKARIPEVWNEKLNTIILENPKPPLKVIKALLSEGERIPWPLEHLPNVRLFVERCNEWIEEATYYTTRKQQNRKKNDRVWRRVSQAKQTEIDERERELRRFDNMKSLLQRAHLLGFDCPEVGILKERAQQITDFQYNARAVVANVADRKPPEIEELLEIGRGFPVDVPEVDQLDKIVRQMKWLERASERGSSRTLHDVDDLIVQAGQLNVPESNEHLTYLKDQKRRGEAWEAKARELMAAETVHHAQLELFSKQAAELPVPKETLAAIDGILKKQREARDMIVSLYERSRDPDIRNRPHYKEVRDVMDFLSNLNSKPAGTVDLEKEQKRHEDWMRRGKKLFGKTNAPLHILLQHMKTVDERNKGCFDMADRPRMPVEPSSREHTPDSENEDEEQSASSRDVFCICRQSENGTMIECTLCHEWYHSTCLKIARGKVKEDDDFICPICDWRVKIPRDATRPKLEELVNWQSEIADLPFQPEEEECLVSIIDTAQAFRDFMSPYINPLCSTSEEVPTQRFYLRKIEGADILLASETNFLRQELHRLWPVAPEPPPISETSLSTRKPRPTKQQKLMQQHGVDNVEDLPPEVKLKQKRRRQTMDENGNSHRSASNAGQSSTNTGKSGRRSSGAPTTLNFKPPITANTFPLKSYTQHNHNNSVSSTNSISDRTGINGSQRNAPLKSPTSPVFGSTPSNPFAGNSNTLPTMSPSFLGRDEESASPTHNPNLDPNLFGTASGIGSFMDDEFSRRDSHFNDTHHDEMSSPPRDSGEQDRSNTLFAHNTSSQQSGGGGDGGRVGDGTTSGGGGHFDDSIWTDMNQDDHNVDPALLADDEEMFAPDDP